MQIRKKIENIKNKPEHVRERYVWVLVIFCMIFIFGLWVFSLRTVFSFNNLSDDIANTDNSKEHQLKQLEK